MKILITGSSGLIGQALTTKLNLEGHTVQKLQRNDSTQALFWDTLGNKVNLPNDSYFDAVIHLAGENIATGRWTKSKKEQIRESRLQGTKALYEALSALEKKPSIIITASALGYYGSQGSTQLDETSPVGSGFLATLCKEWEDLSSSLEHKNTRFVSTRFGLILAPSGGLLKTILPIFKLGLGGRIGDGKQYMSWISLDDTVRAIVFCLMNDSVQGPINITAPTPITNAEFTKKLGQALHRPAICHIPQFIIKLIMGQMGTELLLRSAQGNPSKLLKHGFTFNNVEIEACFKHYFS